MHDVVTIGSATVDIFMKSSQFHLQHVEEGLLLCEKYGSKLDIEDFKIQSGGAGTNTAVGFRRMGFQTAVVAEIGKDFLAQVIWDELRREHVDTSALVSEQHEQTAVSVLLISEDGGRSALTHRGAAAMLEARDLPWPMLGRTRWIHLSNVGANQELLLRLFDFLRQQKIGLSWNPGQGELKLLAEGKLSIAQLPCEILLINAEEWQLLKPVYHQVLTHIPFVVITDGKAGGEVVMKGQYRHKFTAEQVEAVQETGAGDAFGVGFVSAHILGRPIEECCRWGIQNATNVIKHMGAKTGLLHRKDFRQ